MKDMEVTHNVLVGLRPRISQRGEPSRTPGIKGTDYLGITAVHTTDYVGNSLTNYQNFRGHGCYHVYMEASF